jgi:hypothetical protein
MIHHSVAYIQRDILLLIYFYFIINILKVFNLTSLKPVLKSGSLYYNYKGWFSIILLAVCDARYSFTLVDIGSYGSSNDSGVFSNSNMGHALEGGQRSIPSAEPIDGLPNNAVPYFLVGDEAFALKQWILRPYSGRDLPEDL